MLNVKRYAEKTCNLRITAIHSLLEFAAHEDSENLMSVYLDASTVKGIKVNPGPIEYFEGYQMKALLAAPNPRTRIESRNQMMSILYYDTAARIAELLEMNLGQLHLDAETPYLTILGKDKKAPQNTALSDRHVLYSGENNSLLICGRRVYKNAALQYRVPPFIYVADFIMPCLSYNCNIKITILLIFLAYCDKKH